ncbi:MAG: dephospho-CoA kinase, partial [Gaiellaceae bacterium]
AITGGIGAGKSAALAAFHAHGAATVSSDEIVHHLLASDPDVREALVAEEVALELAAEAVVADELAVELAEEAIVVEDVAVELAEEAEAELEADTAVASSADEAETA